MECHTDPVHRNKTGFKIGLWPCHLQLIVEYFNVLVLIDFMNQQEKQIILQMNIFCASMQVLL